MADVEKHPAEEGNIVVLRSEFMQHVQQNRDDFEHTRESIKDLYNVTKENHGTIQKLLRFQSRAQVILGLVTVVGTGIGSLILKLLYDYIKMVSA